MKISKLIQNIRIFIFKFFYPKIKKIISVTETKLVLTKKVIFEKKKFYNLFLIQKGRIYSTSVHDVAYLIGDVLLNEPSYQYRYKKNLKIYNAKPELNFCINKGTPRLKRKIKGTVFSLLSGGAAKNNYWHWMFDTLPRIGIFQKAKLNIRPNYYLVPSIAKKFQIESLQSLDISKEQLIDGNKFKHLFCENLIATSHPVVFKNNPSNSMLNVPIWTIKWLRKNFLKLNIKCRKLYKKIYIDRKIDSSIGQRRIFNHDLFLDFLKKRGFEIIYPENFNFLEQIKIFNSADIIIGMHGAGLTNIIFSTKKTKIIEIGTRESGNLYSNLAKKCKLNYYKVLEKNLSKDLLFQNFYINVNFKKLEKVLKN